MMQIYMITGLIFAVLSFRSTPKYCRNPMCGGSLVEAMMMVFLWPLGIAAMIWFFIRGVK